MAVVEVVMHLDLVQARGLADPRDALADLVEEGGLISRHLDHRVDLAAERLDVGAPLLVRRLHHQLRRRHAVILEEAREDVDEQPPVALAV